MEQNHKDEPAKNNIGRELFVSSDSDEIIPERMLDIEEGREAEDERLEEPTEE